TRLPSTDTDPSLVEDCGCTSAASGFDSGVALSSFLSVPAKAVEVSSSAASTAARGSLRMGWHPAGEAPSLGSTPAGLHPPEVIAQELAWLQKPRPRTGRRQRNAPRSMPECRRGTGRDDALSRLGACPWSSGDSGERSGAATCIAWRLRMPLSAGC